jgi:thiosulfate/3-mercaptopyruvate sulfurtransferase
MRREQRRGLIGMVALLLCGGFLRATVEAQAPGSMLISTEQVAALVGQPQVVLLHVGPAQAYPARHLHGARLVTTGDISVPGTLADGTSLNLQLPDADTLKTQLEVLGISDDSRIIVYAAAPGMTSSATRVMVTLQAAGLGDRAQLMDGGLTKWAAEGRAVTDEVPAPVTGTLRALEMRPLVVDGDEVLARMGTSGTTIVDARTPAFYSGASTGGSQQAPHKTGHIASAVNVPFASLYDAQGQLRPVDELRAAFTSAGVKPGDQIIAYCHIGQQATVAVFAARLAGFDVRLYDGSFEEWSKRDGAVAIKK